MSAVSRRHRSSTAASFPPEGSRATAELQTLLDSVSSTLGRRGENAYPDMPVLLDQCQSIRQFLIAAPQSSHTNDDFRHLHGYQVLLGSLRAFSGFYHPTRRSQNDKDQLFKLIEITLGIFSQTFRDHYGNRRYFKRKVEGGGWPALEQTIASIGIGGSESDLWSESQLFGRLLAFALDDKRFESLCQAATSMHPSVKQEQEKDEDDGHTAENKTSIRLGKAMVTVDDENVLKFIDTRLGEILKESSLLYNADIVPTILDFWKTIPRQTDTPVNPAAMVVIQTFTKIAAISKHNLLALHATGILSMLLSLAFDSDNPLAASERVGVVSLCGSLMSMGVKSLNDAQYLLCSRNPAAADFLLQRMKDSCGPPYIQFDLSLNGYASVELATLGRSFPPPSNVPGYTFAAWIRIDQFDSNAHTTIFGAFDSSQTCFVLVYFEQDSEYLILQTSAPERENVSSKSNVRASVRFKSTVFQPGRWYHIAIVHKRPKTMTSSKASLYVNGKFAEQVKCDYPKHPPFSNSSTDSFASFTSSAKANPVQAFLGTPQDLSGRLGRGVNFSRWSLASAHLFEDVVSEDLLAVYYHLGPQYSGNFQDKLGSFQTYEAAALLGMRNENLPPGQDASSDILGAIREKASMLVPEGRILLGILPGAIIGQLDQNIHEPTYVSGLNRTAANNLFQLTHNSGTSVAINTAIPCVNEALTRAQGTSVLTGQPVIVVPQTLDDTLWRLGGFAGIALKRIEEASSPDDIVRAVETLFEAIKGSWRNSEAMEREDGFVILGALLRGKVGAGNVVSSKAGPELSNMTNADRESLGFQLLSRVLDFVGYSHEKPDESYIINPLAYRILLVDFDMWRKGATITQRLYYKQFIVFGVSSKFHVFNARRMVRMRTL